MKQSEWQYMGSMVVVTQCESHIVTDLHQELVRIYYMH